MAAVVGQNLEVATKKHEIDLEVVGEKFRVRIIMFVIYYILFIIYLLICWNILPIIVIQALLEEVTKKHDIDLEEVGEKLRVRIIMCVISFFPFHTY